MYLKLHYETFLMKNVNKRVQTINCANRVFTHIHFENPIVMLYIRAIGTEIAHKKS